MPQMGVSVSEGTITRWPRQVGEHVKRRRDDRRDLDRQGRSEVPLRRAPGSSPRSSWPRVSGRCRTHRVIGPSDHVRRPSRPPAEARTRVRFTLRMRREDGEPRERRKARCRCGACLGASLDVSAVAGAAGRSRDVAVPRRARAATRRARPRPGEDAHRHAAAPERDRRKPERHRTARARPATQRGRPVSWGPSEGARLVRRSQGESPATASLRRGDGGGRHGDGGSGRSRCAADMTVSPSATRISVTIPEPGEGTSYRPCRSRSRRSSRRR